MRGFGSEQSECLFHFGSKKTMTPATTMREIEK